jgi:hypothetical protein
MGESKKIDKIMVVLIGNYGTIYKPKQRVERK